jgi:von Willebrand factor A domain-containing protein 7
MRFTILLAACVCLPLSAAAQQGRSGQVSRPGWPCAGNVDPAYVQVSEATGGKVLLFHPTEIGGFAVDERASSQHSETLFRAAGQLAGDSSELTVPIDSTIESAYFSVSVQCLQVVALITPSGQELSIGAEGVEYHQFESIRLFVVPRPAPGMWKVIAAGRGFFSMIVSARTELRLDNVTLVDRGTPPDRKTATSLEATVRGPFRQAGFHFVAGNGSPIQSVDLTLYDESPHGRNYAGLVTRPRANFRVAVSGLDSSGFQFQRMESRLSMGSASSK